MLVFLGHPLRKAFSLITESPSTGLPILLNPKSQCGNSQLCESCRYLIHDYVLTTPSERLQCLIFGS
ncbi:hypothetical protein M8J76_011265 [Diaphorina citri]|nr:hypothetical protein M8J76_011265 [Diaphorina citri]